MKKDLHRRDFLKQSAATVAGREGFDYAVQNGADFLCVGMFDFQVQEDVQIAQEFFNKHQTRPRPWRA